MKKLSEVAKIIPATEVNRMVRIIRTADVHRNSINLSNEERIGNWLVPVQKDDLLLVPGRCGMFPEVEENYFTTTGIVVIRCTDYDPYLLWAVLNQKNVMARLEAECGYDGLLRGFNPKKVRNFMVPACPTGKDLDHILDVIKLANNLHKLRKQQEKLYEELIDSLVYHKIIKPEREKDAKVDRQDHVQEGS